MEERNVVGCGKGERVEKCRFVVKLDLNICGFGMRGGVFVGDGVFCLVNFVVWEFGKYDLLLMVCIY